MQDEYASVSILKLDLDCVWLYILKVSERQVCIIRKMSTIIINTSLEVDLG